MLQFLKELFFKDRRHYPRHLVNGSFVLVVPTKEGNTSKWKVDVIDISLGGAAFIYEGSPDDLAKTGLIKLSNDMPEALEFKTISDVECSKGSTYRKRGVKFEWKGFLGKKQLLEFIEEYGLLLEE
jgi:hypothetical protein